MRLLNILVIGALILAASFVYKIKFDSTLQAERVAKLRGELRRERNAIAVLARRMGKARHARPHSGACRTPPGAAAGQTGAIRQSRPPARAAAGCRTAGPASDPIGAMLAPGPDTTGSVLPPARAVTDQCTGPNKHTESRWQRILRSLLYGHDVDRNVKAKARLGLAIVAFAGIFSVIAVRLVMFAIGARRPRRPRAAWCRMRWPPRGPISSTATAKFSRPTSRRRRCSPSRARSSMSTKRLNCSPRSCPISTPPKCASALSSKRGFVWLKREITPSQQQEIHRLGIPGVGFLTENKRVYPNGPVVSHEIGHVNIDNQGIAGIEKWLDGQGLAALHMAGLATDQLQRPVKLAVDLRVQYALRDELIAAREKFKAKASAGMIADVNTGEIIAMVSVPDFDPNNPREANDPNRLNRLTTGVYEMGSTFKALTLAMALDSGRISLSSTFDASIAVAVRQIRNQRLSRAEARAVGPGNLHVLVQHRHRAHGALARRRLPQSVPEKVGAA